jgi:hypothetical protein
MEAFKEKLRIYPSLNDQCIKPRKHWVKTLLIFQQNIKEALKVLKPSTTNEIYVGLVKQK